MKVLVMNCGSSSLKYQLFDMTDETVLAKGYLERVGMMNSIVTHKPKDKEPMKMTMNISDHDKGVELVLRLLVDPINGVIKSMKEISAVGHRVVHGGEMFYHSVLITPNVIEAIQECAELAPLHNPANLLGIAACQRNIPKVPQVAVFDTAFHQTIPQYAFLYGLPYEAYEKYGLRKYGFHGTSHRYVTKKAADLLGRPLDELKLISCHLGSGSSVCAVEYGQSIDTSMGFTPLQGLVMGTRCGNIDPAIISFLMRKENMTVDQIDDYLNKKSGVLGISGLSSDFRDIEEAALQGNEKAQLALDVFVYNVRKFIGTYYLSMGGVDALVFTAGLGENSKYIRNAICKDLDILGITLDSELNNVRGQEQEISSKESKVKVFVIPTDEELVIARDTKQIYLLNMLV